MPIPAIIHQIWMSGEPPPRLASAAASWREQHPSWEYRLWTEVTLAELVRTQYAELWDLYRGYPEMIQRVDAARYMLLHHFGGVYADFDVECVRPLEPLRTHRVVLPATDPLGLANDLMLAQPRHPVFASIVGRLPQSFSAWQRPYVPRHFRILLTTGSLHLTRSVARAAERSEVHVLPREAYSSQDRATAYVYHWPGNGWAAWDTRLLTGIYYGWRRVVSNAKRRVSG